MNLAYLDRNQRSIFLGFEFRESVFLGYGHSCCIFWGVCTVVNSLIHLFVCVL